MEDSTRSPLIGIVYRTICSCLLGAAYVELDVEMSIIHLPQHTKSISHALEPGAEYGVLCAHVIWKDLTEFFIRKDFQNERSFFDEVTRQNLLQM